ncbi:MAG: transmembrane transporter [Comamonadaceae bacterium PBBC1]|nr:MAG: transmembrane transporter [Comamonadaceae bacterium PBBC1]
MAILDQSRQVLAKILGPLLISVSILVVFFFGGEAYQQFGIEFVDSTTTVVKNVLGVIGFFSLAVLANRLIRYVIFEGFIASATGTPVPRLLLQISSLIIYAIAISACARIVFNQDLTFLWAASGVAGLVLGMALKELLQDVFAGIALNIDRAVRIGDWIQIHKSGDERTIGQMMEISWRTTRVRDLLGDMISFPNSKFSSFTISNFSLPEEVSNRRVYITLECTVPVDQAFRILQAAALDALLELIGPNVAVPTVAVNGVKIDGVEYMIGFNAQWKFLMPGTRAIYKHVLIHLAKAGLRPAGRAMTVTERGEQEVQHHLPDASKLTFLIDQSPIFEGVPTFFIERIIARSRKVRMPSGRVVIQAGEVGGEMYVVQEGLLDALEPLKLAGSAGNKPAVIRPGDTFGEQVALVGLPHRRTIRARTDVLLLEIDGNTLQHLLEVMPGALELLARNLARMGVMGNSSSDEDMTQALARQITHMFPGVLALSTLADANGPESKR